MAGVLRASFRGVDPGHRELFGQLVVPYIAAAFDVFDDTFKQADETERACVDDSRRTQHPELIGRPAQRLPCPHKGAPEAGADVLRPGPSLGLHFLCEGLDYAQDRALAGLGHRLPGAG